MASGSISGIVTTALGVPLPAATVTLLRGEGTVVSTTSTVMDGSYSFSTVPAGEYIVRTSLLTFQTAVAGVTVVDGQNSTANFSLASNPGAISGQVLNTTPVPIAGATVNAIQNDILIGSATTNGSGDYTINGLAAGSYIVTAAASGYQTGTTGAAVLAGQTTTVNFSLLSSPGTISGTVISADGGMPISNALVQVSSGGTVIYSALTNGSGNYTVTGVAAGSYTVTAASATYDTGVTGATVTAGDTTTVNFSLEASPGTISGTVTSQATGLPISGALVEANLASIVVGFAVTDNSGYYVIPGVAPGSYIVDAYATDYQTGTAGAIVLSNQTTTVNFSLQSSPGIISGTVTSAMGGTPIASTLVQVIYDGAVIDSTLTDSSGNYLITGVAPGSYTVTAAATSYDTGVTGAIVSANETTIVDFSLAASPGAISGTVTSFVGSIPISGALIEVSLDNTIIFSTLTDNSGNYSISGVAPGSYIVHAHAANYQTGTMGAIVIASITTTVDFSLHASPGAISGSVRSAATGLPISGALVEANLASIVIGSAVTDSSGNYSIPGMAPGSYIVDAYAANYETGTAGAIVLSNETTAVDFSLQSSPGTISGTVTSAMGATPIAGAVIQVIYDDAVIDSILTDSSGDYIITGLAPGSYTVTAAAASYDTGVTGAIVSANETTIVDFSLDASPGAISGTVTSFVGSTPIPGALIEVSLDNIIIFSTLTDSLGDYSISGVSPGSYIVHAYATNYQTGTTGALVASNTTTTVDFSLLASPGAISGTVTSAITGSPISGALIEVSLGSIVVDSAVTDNSGNYSISGVPPGSYIVDAYATNYQTGTAGAIILSNETTTVDFSLQSNPGTLSGRVTSSMGGSPIAGALIQLSNGDAVIDSTLTDNFGNYTIIGIVPGSYTVIATSPTYDTGVTGAIISANETTTVNFSLQASPGSISGTVVSAIGSSPISGVLIEVTLNNMLIFSTLTDTSGDYSISGISPGSYVVHAYATNYQTGSAGALIVSNTTTTVNFSLVASPGTIAGTVTSAATGLPISGALVEVNLSSIVIDSAVTDSSGSYSISGMPPGSYIVDAYATNYQTGTTGAIVLSNATTTVDFSLQPNPGTVVGTVISAQSGLPISGALVELSLNNAVIFSVLTDSSGNYSISGIAPASYTVDAYAANYQTSTNSATVSSNQTTQVNFSLQSSPGTISGTVTSAMGSSPISGALVEVNLNNTLIFSTLTDSSGHYSISGAA